MPLEMAISKSCNGLEPTGVNGINMYVDMPRKMDISKSYNGLEPTGAQNNNINKSNLLGFPPKYNYT